MAEGGDDRNGGAQAAPIPALRAVLGCGALFTAACAFHGARWAISCAAGVTLSAVNLWLLARVVGAFVATQSRGGWSVAAVLKAVLLYGAVVVMVNGGLVEMVPLLVGLAALPVGIVAHALLGRYDLV